MHGNTFHSLWVLQLENNDSFSGHQENKNEHSSKSESSSFAVTTNTKRTQNRFTNHVICSPYRIQQTSKLDESHSIQFNIKSDSKYLLTHMDLSLLLITSSLNALLVKVFCVFSGFIYLHIQFTTLTLILGISSLSTMIAVFINPYVVFLRCNLLIFVIQCIQIVGLMMIITFHHNEFLLTIGISLIFNAYQIHWGVANSMIACFISPRNRQKSSIKHAAITKKKYLTIFNTQWTISTLYFFIVGVISQSSSFFGFLTCIMAIAIVLAILNVVILPKQPPLPSILPTHVNISNLAPSSFRKDIAILFASSNKNFPYVCAGFMLIFFIWGWFYVTFGPFLQKLYHLDSIQFGAYVAVIEFVGNSIAMLSYICLGSLVVIKKSEKKLSKLYFETEILLLISSIILFISFLCISSITHIIALRTLLQNEIIVGCIIVLYFVGHEGCVIGLMILHVEVTPMLQQPRASGIVSLINCIMVCISQSIIIGPLSAQYYTINFVTETIILLITSVILLMIMTVLAITMYKSRHNKIISQSEVSPMLKTLHGKSYTYHTLHPMSHAGSTDLLFNPYRI